MCRFFIQSKSRAKYSSFYIFKISSHFSHLDHIKNSSRHIFILSNVNCFNMAKTHNNHSLEAKNNAIYSQCHPFTCSRLGNFSL